MRTLRKNQIYLIEFVEKCSFYSRLCNIFYMTMDTSVPMPEGNKKRWLEIFAQRIIYPPPPTQKPETPPLKPPSRTPFRKSPLRSKIAPRFASADGSTGPRGRIRVHPSEPCAVRRWTHFTGNHYRACEEAECGGDYSWKSGVFVPIGILFPNRVAYHLYYLHLLHRNGECQNEARLN